MQLTLKNPSQIFRPSDVPSAPVPGLYLHVPFCFHKCHYCDFYSITRQSDERMERFVDLNWDSLRRVRDRYLAYVEADASLSDERKQGEKHSVWSWAKLAEYRATSTPEEKMGSTNRNASPTSNHPGPATRSIW